MKDRIQIMVEHVLGLNFSDQAFFCHSYDQDHHAFHDQQYLKPIGILDLEFVSCIVNASLNPTFLSFHPFRQLFLKLNAPFAKHILNIPHSNHLIQSHPSSIT